MHMPEITHTSKPTDVRMKERKPQHIGEGLGVGKKNFRKFSLSLLPGVSFI